jgi:hypothetical protein
VRLDGQSCVASIVNDIAGAGGAPQIRPGRGGCSLRWVGMVDSQRLRPDLRLPTYLRLAHLCRPIGGDDLVRDSVVPP